MNKGKNNAYLMLLRETKADVRDEKRKYVKDSFNYKYYDGQLKILKELEQYILLNIDCGE